MQISDAATGVVLDTETVSSFSSGVYLKWTVSGNIVITITRLAGQMPCSAACSSTRSRRRLPHRRPCSSTATRRRRELVQCNGSARLCLIIRFRGSDCR